jgi:hypothetical protein
LADPPNKVVWVIETKEDPGEIWIREGAVLFELALKVAPLPSRHILDPKTRGALVAEYAADAFR